jgi:hypothetical protein
MSHCGLVIYIKKYLKAKKKNYENSNTSSCKNIIKISKILYKNQNLSRYYNFIMKNTKFQ